MRQNPGVAPPLFTHRPHQIGILVRDIEAAVARHEALLGPQEWIRVENGPHNLHGLHYRGSPADYSMLLALSGSDPQLELLQPLAGPSILQEWLDRRGEGLHHLGIEVASVDATIAEMEEEGYPCLQHGYGFGADGSGAFAYFDTEAELGYLLEAIEPATG
jgi:catechol 2,3-dioxygenase-like lactoylglutathione lyase family enzyme